MGLTEYVLLALVILVPLVVAGAVTLWSLEQARYRPKRARRPPAATSQEREVGASRGDPAPDA